MNFIALLGGVRATVFFAVALAVSGWATYEHLQRMDAEADLKTQTLALEISAKEHSEYKLRKEREMALRLNELSKAHLDQQTKANEDYQSTLARIRSDNLRLRPRFVCADPAATAPSGPGSDGGTPTGLLREDAEFLVSEAKRADDVVRQLLLAQGTIRTLQEAMQEHDKLHAR